MIKKLTINSNIKDYTVSFEDSFEFFEEYSLLKNKSVIIDKNVYEKFEKIFLKFFHNDDIFLFEAIEENKTIETACEFYDWFCQRNAKKNMNIISIGGGITQDVTGFIASTLYRGINWIFVPTTLLAQTDSCIGSKTSINFHKFKNLIGTFYPPAKLHLFSDFLKTLKDIDIYSGLGEVIKLQLMKENCTKNISDIKATLDKCLNDFAFLQEIIFENLNVKLRYMAGDEFDQGRRNLLNYGHCFGHALEVSSNYEVPHGIAVNIGMIYANIVAVKRKKLSKDLFTDLTSNINIPYIGINLKKEYFCRELLLSGMKNDKKREGENLAIVYPDNSFNLEKYSDLTDSEFTEALNKLMLVLF